MTLVSIRRGPAWCAVAGAAFFLLAGPAYGQSTDRPPGRIEVEVGGGILGGGLLGKADANLRTNATEKRPYRLFSADTRVTSAPALHTRVAFALNRRFSVEGSAVFGRPRIRTSVSADVEGAAPLTVDERIDQYFVEGSLLVLFEELRIGRRTVPFAVAGAGYLRQLHEGLMVIEDGRVYHVGGGVKHWLLARDRGFIKAAGLRADARLYLLAGGVSFDNGPKPRGAASGSVFISF